MYRSQSPGREAAAVGGLDRSTAHRKLLLRGGREGHMLDELGVRGLQPGMSARADGSGGSYERLQTQRSAVGSAGPLPEDSTAEGMLASIELFGRP